MHVILPPSVLIWTIEIREAGVWVTQDEATSLEDALTLASRLCRRVREEWIRIVTPDCTIL